MAYFLTNHQTLITRIEMVPPERDRSLSPTNLKKSKISSRREDHRLLQRQERQALTTKTWLMSMRMLFIFLNSNNNTRHSRHMFRSQCTCNLPKSWGITTNTSSLHRFTRNHQKEGSQFLKPQITMKSRCTRSTPHLPKTRRVPQTPIRIGNVWKDSLTRNMSANWSKWTMRLWPNLTLIDRSTKWSQRGWRKSTWEPTPGEAWAAGPRWEAAVPSINRGIPTWASSAGPVTPEETDFSHRSRSIHSPQSCQMRELTYGQSRLFTKSFVPS